MPEPSEKTEEESIFASLCLRLEALGRRLGIRAKKNRDSAPDPNLDLSGLSLGDDTIAIASRTFAILLALLFIPISPLIVAICGFALALPLAFVSIVVPYLAKEAIRSYPASLAKKRALEVLRSSNEGINLMIMSLRHEPSLSKAIGFASRRGTAFSRELRGCTWGVIMGRFSSFEESIYAFAGKWSEFAHELKTSMNALVTASCEATEDGKRRALDRANQAMISGARRRIEEYALSLSTPSMILFGLGILLPLMVGSFLPMLSWNLWTAEGMSGVELNHAKDNELVRSVFLMNILFPAIALAVVLNALSRHPTHGERHHPAEKKEQRVLAPLIVLAISVALVVVVSITLDGVGEALAMLISCIVPTSLWLMARETAPGTKPTSRELGAPEDALFKTGGYMVEGENFESSFRKAAAELASSSSTLAREIRLHSNLRVSAPNDGDLWGEQGADDNAIIGLRITKEAAKKNERSAGLLAMDLAAYLRDLRELETGLKNRIKPTITMMKITAHILAPVVLGVTYAIYLSLGSIVDFATSVNPAHFLLVLGTFLAEINVIVVYFVWGIDGGGDRKSFTHSLGICLLASQLIFSATAIFTS